MSVDLPYNLKAGVRVNGNIRGYKLERERPSGSVSYTHLDVYKRQPVDHRFKKKEVKGVSAKVITAAMLGGDLYPATAIGINLPNRCV